MAGPVRSQLLWHLSSVIEAFLQGARKLRLSVGVCSLAVGLEWPRWLTDALASSGTDPGEVDERRARGRRGVQRGMSEKCPFGFGL